MHVCGRCDVEVRSLTFIRLFLRANMKVGLALLSSFVLVSLCGVSAKLKGDDCEVCINFLKRFSQRLREGGIDPANQIETEMEFLKTCALAKGKDERFCYYIGAADTSATKLIKEVTKPLSFSKPEEKICEDLKKKDAQICELRYEKQIDWGSIDLKKLRVKELKKILSDWGEDCRGCAEKVDYINKINDVKPKHLAHTEL